MIPLTHYQGKTVAVLGLGITGEASVRALSAGGANVIAWDGRSDVIERLSNESLVNVTYSDVVECDWSHIDCLVLSAGIPLTHPTPHPVVAKAQAVDCPIICDIELLYQQCPDATYVAITGTNGKSTTTALIGHVLKSCGMTVEIGGNIGKSGVALKPLSHGGIYVIEMSSYQLDLLDKTHFNIAVLLNITPDHLDRHGDMAGYRRAKMHVFDHQTSRDMAVIGIDNEISRECLEELSQCNDAPMMRPISTQYLAKNGVRVCNGMIAQGNETYTLGDLPKLPGMHNAENIAAAFAVACALGAKLEDIIAAIKEFQGLPHRMQWVTQRQQVTFINDSKATNAEAASKALGAYDSVYWIAGGRAKEGGIDTLVEYFPRIKKAFLIGEAEQEFAATLEAHNVAYECVHHLVVAVSEAAKAANLDPNENVVLFSPACASFDQWPNFEARGEAFCRFVNQLEGSDAV